MAAASKSCTECEGDGECKACSGSGVDVGVAMLAGYEGDCEVCGGTGACPACGGTHSRKAKRGLSDSKSDRPPGAVLYSEKLLGLRSECPACGEWESSTGWLLYREGEGFRWYVDLKCTGCHSQGATWKREWLPLIEEVLKAEGGS